MNRTSLSMTLFLLLASPALAQQKYQKTAEKIISATLESVASPQDDRLSERLGRRTPPR